MMKNIEGGGASELHFITSKNPNIFNLGGEVARYLFFSSSVWSSFDSGNVKLISEHWNISTYGWQYTYKRTFFFHYLYGGRGVSNLLIFHSFVFHSSSRGGRGKVNDAIFTLSAIFFIMMASLNKPLQYLTEDQVVVDFFPACQID